MKKHLAQLSSSSSSIVNPFDRDLFDSSSKLALLSSIALSTFQTNRGDVKENLPQNSTDDDETTSGLSDDDDEEEEEEELEEDEDEELEDDEEDEDEEDLRRPSLSIDPTEEVN